MNRHTHLSAVAAVVIICILSRLANAVDYTYEEFNANGVRNNHGPTKWGDIRDVSSGAVKYPSCSAGSSGGSVQSPIDLAPQLERTSATVEGSSGLAQSHPALGPLLTENGLGNNHLIAGSAQTSFTLSNDGGQMKATFDVPATNKIASSLPQFVDPLSRDGSARYILKDMYFHSVSDHAIADSRADFEVQLHFEKISSSAGTASVSSGGAQSDATMVVISILMDACLYCKNEELAKFWHLLPAWNRTTATSATPARTTRVAPVLNINFNVVGLLPPSRDYATYLGSLTFPPCTPNVRHYILDGQSSSGAFPSNYAISYAQIEHFSKVMGWKTTPTSNSHINLAPFGNYRPLQSDATSRNVIYRYKEIGDAGTIENGRTASVFYDSSKDEGSALAEEATIAAFVGMVLGFLATVISVVAMYQTYTRSAGANESASTAAGAGGKKKMSTTAETAGPNSKPMATRDKYAAESDDGTLSQISGVTPHTGGDPTPDTSLTHVDRRTRVQRFDNNKGASPSSTKRRQQQ